MKIPHSVGWLIVIYLLYYAVCSVRVVASEKITFFAVEQPKILYSNPKYISFLNISSRRYNRRDPVHYFSFHFHNLYPIGDNVTFSYYFYEWLTNQYKPSFVELHVKACYMLDKEPIFGPTIKRALLKIKPDFRCPLPVGDWNMQNCTVNAAAIPNFPFSRGRIYVNVSVGSRNGEPIGNVYMNFQIKQIKVKTQSVK